MAFVISARELEKKKRTGKIPLVFFSENEDIKLMSEIVGKQIEEIEKSEKKGGAK